MNVFIGTSLDKSGDKSHIVATGGGVVIRTSVRSNIATDMIGQYVLTEIGQKSGVRYQITCDKNTALSPESPGWRTTSRTGIRTAEVALPASSLEGLRVCIDVNDVISLTQYVRAFLELYEPETITFGSGATREPLDEKEPEGPSQ